MRNHFATFITCCLAIAMPLAAGCSAQGDDVSQSPDLASAAHDQQATFAASNGMSIDYAVDPTGTELQAWHGRRLVLDLVAGEGDTVTVVDLPDVTDAEGDALGDLITWLDDSDSTSTAPAMIDDAAHVPPVVIHALRCAIKCALPGHGNWVRCMRKCLLPLPTPIPLPH